MTQADQPEMTMARLSIASALTGALSVKVAAFRATTRVPVVVLSDAEGSVSASPTVTLKANPLQAGSTPVRLTAVVL